MQKVSEEQQEPRETSGTSVESLRSRSGDTDIKKCLLVNLLFCRFQFL
jgi:hypothetical protein